MRQLFLKKGEVFLQEVPVPVLEDNNILVKVYYSFISSGTEISTLNLSEKSIVKKFAENSINNTKKVVENIKENGVLGTLALVKEKMNFINSLGYSCSGKVLAVGKSIEKFRVGDYVACAGSGFANHADVVSIPENLAVKVIDKSFLKQSSLTTIGAIAMQGIRRADLKLGEKVCILGLGLIGQITVQLAKLSGCQVFGIDLNQKRIELAKKNGADFVFNVNEIDAKKELDFASFHYKMDSTIITAASKSGSVIDLAMDITRRKGRVVLVGDVKLDFNRDVFYSKEIDFLISCSYGPGRYDNSYELYGKDYPYSYVRWTENRNMQLFASLIENGKLDINSLICDEFDLEKIDVAYNYLKENKALGIVLNYNQEKPDSKKVIKKDIKISTNKCSNEKINVGFVGVGGFAKIKLLPILSKNKNINICSVIDTNSTSLLNIANLYKAKKIGNDLQKLIEDDDINLIVIATPHKLHFNQTISSLKKRKAVFVEKPAVVSFDQLKFLQNFLNENKNCYYCVDFNRSFAPFNLAIKKELKKCNNPIIIHYRMNSGFIPKEHWIQDNENRGRIIGEACHIFELFCFLTDSKPLSISVHSLSSLEKDILANDNVVISLNMNDGSCCSLIYTAIGNSAVGKERMEIFFDGKSIVMEDYLTLNGFGLPVSFNKKVNFADKGHEDLLFKFVENIKNLKFEVPIPFERIFIATKLSLIADKLAREGGGYEHIGD